MSLQCGKKSRYTLSAFINLIVFNLIIMPVVKANIFCYLNGNLVPLGTVGAYCRSVIVTTVTPTLAPTSTSTDIIIVITLSVIAICLLAIIGVALGCWFYGKKKITDQQRTMKKINDQQRTIDEQAAKVS